MNSSSSASSSAQFRKHAAGCLRFLLAAALLQALVACGNGDGPGTPKAPKPVTELGYYTTTQMELPARPVMSQPGMM